MTLRFEPAAAGALRDAIRAAGGVEVFAIGDVVAGHVAAVTITCRGTEDRVPALLDRPRAGQVVIHNHPSGDLRPSEPDLALAHRYGEDGVGVVIVDSAVTRSNWVVEPYVRRLVAIDQDRLEAFFLRDLPRALPGWESRPQQLEMAREVARSFDEERPLLCEAGTGTGKSLAYLVPAALWALANDAKVAVSTYTKALQAQLVSSDLPLLARGGIEVRTAVLQGRNNYLCKRRLALSLEEDPDDDRQVLEALRDWSATATEGSRGHLGFQVSGPQWERVMSDADLTLSVRCPHYEACHWYKARRAASGAHLLVVNHALLLTDLAIRGDAGRGFLPKYERIVLDEGHHLEDAATGISTEKLSATAVERATWGVLDAPRRKGAMSRLLDKQLEAGGALAPDQRQRLEVRALTANALLDGLRHGAALSLGHVAATLLPDDDPHRVVEATETGEAWQLEVAPSLTHLAGEIEAAADALGAVDEVFEGVVLPEEQAQPLLDLRRARRRLAAQALMARAFLEPAEGVCRWVEPERGRQGDRRAAPSAAPVEVGPVLARRLWAELPGTVVTSATLTVGGRFEHLARRVGLFEPRFEADRGRAEAVFPSPFDHARQALLALPRDLPAPDDPGFAEASAKVIADAIRLSDGGAFVLCTSHAAVRAYGEAVRALTGDRPVLVQGEGGRELMLERFKENRRSVLVGTDSFWEGVSVRGEGLRLVIIPRIPFRVPTEPLQQARHERIASRGGDPFRAYSLPEAVLKLRQGYGRLIRSKTDRGVVLLLDRRIHERSYGALVLHSLPPARRVTGPWQRVRQDVAAAFGPVREG